MERNGPIRGLLKRHDIQNMVPNAGLRRHNKDRPQVSIWTSEWMVGSFSEPADSALLEREK